MVHGDLKCENILLTRDDWLVLSDFAPFKPIQLPLSNPAEFTYYFDTSRRRAAYLAPERFIATDDKDFFPILELERAMDIFSAGCIIAELFNDGQPLFTYGDILAFTDGTFNPDLSNLDDDIQDLVKQMIQRSSKNRPSATKLIGHHAFGSNFESLYATMSKYKAILKKDKGFSGDDLIREFALDGLDKVLQLAKHECVIPLRRGY